MKCWISLLFVAIASIQCISASKVYVGNLSWNSTDEGLRLLFEEFGQVIDSVVMRDRDSGRSRGFGFVTMATDEQARMAIEALNDTEFDGRRIKVNAAIPFRN
ncbi:Glycine-rich RNA-binding protein 1 [Pseudolycoriella hygida]|uniref:Glycine-rich RNA-binding protein 1 n=1 Tax=Pseudolycoriella hygida TaxID=35572 RepID=A0A9Q0NBB0_9DIPT|nr:Glycine-rich RNA-binding protein 1 [Pseudolycoriella hygida]